jgi:anti-sigma B factor antagonist
MTDDAGLAGQAPDGAASDRPAGAEPQARFEFLPGHGQESPVVLAAGDIDLTNVGQFEDALAQAADDAGSVTVDLTGVTYCDSATIRALFGASRRVRLTIRVSEAGPVSETLLKVSGLDQVTRVVTAD